MLTNGYKDPAQEKMASGRSMADSMRPTGLRGLKGVVVGPAGVDGRATNFNPHDRHSIVINVEPDSGNSQSFTLADFTKTAVSAALAQAQLRMPGNDIESIRERAAMVFEELATMSNSGVVARQPIVPAVPPPGPPPVPPATPAPPTAAAIPPDIDRGYSPMAAFGLKKNNAAAAKQISGPAASAGLPTRLVYFEKEGIGTVPAFFHDVIIDVNFDEETLTDTGFVVLVYDLRFEQATARWFPPSDDPYKRPWAVQINNDSRLYLVHTTGFQYTYDNREFCVLMVEKAVTGE
jgi:hypothetical protein